jgi:hypothetical protein
MAEELALGLRPTKDVFSFDISPELQAINANVAAKHDEEVAPLAKAVTVIGNPNAPGEEKVKATEQIKPFTNRSDFRAADFIQSVLNLNVRDAIISATGGTHTRAEAYDQNGNKYYKIFNQRITKQNPYGEVVGYEDTKFQPLSPKDIQDKIIVSQVEVPLTQRPFYKANQITAEAAATAQAENWNRLQTTAATATLAAPELKALTQDNFKHLDLLQSKSLDPATRALLYGASEIRTGNTQALTSAADQLNEFAKGKGTKEAWDNFKKVNAGLTMGINYNEGKGTTDSKGNTVDEKELNRRIETLKSEMSSTNAITARKEDLLNKAQALKLKDTQSFDALQNYINNEYKKGLLINEIQKKGGITIAQPNIPYQTGDSFSLAYVKNQSDDAYADLAKHFADKVAENSPRYRNSTPGIGEIELQIAQDPIVKSRKAQVIRDITDFETRIKPVQEQINKQTVAPELLTQPSIAQTNRGSSSSAKPAVPPQGPISTAPAGSRAPTPDVAPATTPARTPRPLGDIFRQ